VTGYSNAHENSDLRTSVIRYEGLTAVGDSFLPFFVQANSDNPNNASDVYSTRVGP